MSFLSVLKLCSPKDYVISGRCVCVFVCVPVVKNRIQLSKL